MNKHRKGFTLIELLVVISLVSFFSSIVIGFVRQSVTKSNDVRRKQNVDQIVKAINFYFNDNGYLPQKSDDWCSYISNPNGPPPGYGQAFQLSVQPYMKTVPLDPTRSGQVGDYLYKANSNANGHFDVCAIMEIPTGQVYDYTYCLGGTIYNYCIKQ